MNEKVYECLTIGFTLNRKKFVISNIYRSPSANIHQFLEHLDELLENYDGNNVPHLLCLDSNINLFNINTCRNAQNYLETLHSNGYMQHIHKATRVTINSFSLIDNICTNGLPKNVVSGTVISDLSDHFINFLILPENVPKTKNKEKLVRNFSEDNKDKFRLALSSLNWAFVTSVDDANDAFSIFWETFSSLYDIYFPLEKRKFNKNVHRINAYMTAGSMKSRLTKMSLYK
jgi:hypothetical protein